MFSAFRSKGSALASERSESEPQAVLSPADDDEQGRGAEKYRNRFVSASIDVGDTNSSQKRAAPPRDSDSLAVKRKTGVFTITRLAILYVILVMLLWDASLPRTGWRVSERTHHERQLDLLTLSRSSKDVLLTTAGGGGPLDARVVSSFPLGTDKDVGQENSFLYWLSSLPLPHLRLPWRTSTGIFSYFRHNPGLLAGDELAVKQIVYLKREIFQDNSEAHLRSSSIVLPREDKGTSNELATSKNTAPLQITRRHSPEDNHEFGSGTRGERIVTRSGSTSTDRSGGDKKLFEFIYLPPETDTSSQVQNILSGLEKMNDKGQPSAEEPLPPNPFPGGIGFGSVDARTLLSLEPMKTKTDESSWRREASTSGLKNSIQGDSTRTGRQIWDCFLFSGELDLLEARLGELHDVVTGFVIVESNYTLQLEPKPLYLKNNYARFKKWHSKMYRYEIAAPPAMMPGLLYGTTTTSSTTAAVSLDGSSHPAVLQGGDVAKPVSLLDGGDLPDFWAMEVFQRNAIGCAFRDDNFALKNQVEDSALVFVMDVDEIPHPALLQELKFEQFVPSPITTPRPAQATQEIRSLHVYLPLQHCLGAFSLCKVEKYWTISAAVEFRFFRDFLNYESNCVRNGNFFDSARGKNQCAIVHLLSRRTSTTSPLDVGAGEETPLTASASQLSSTISAPLGAAAPVADEAAQAGKLGSPAAGTTTFGTGAGTTAPSKGSAAANSGAPPEVPLESATLRVLARRNLRGMLFASYDGASAEADHNEGGRDREQQKHPDDFGGGHEEKSSENHRANGPLDNGASRARNYEVNDGHTATSTERYAEGVGGARLRTGAADESNEPEPISSASSSAPTLKQRLQNSNAFDFKREIMRYHLLLQTAGPHLGVHITPPATEELILKTLSQQCRKKGNTTRTHQLRDVRCALSRRYSFQRSHDSEAARFADMLRHRRTGDGNGENFSGEQQTDALPRSLGLFFPPAQLSKAAAARKIVTRMLPIVLHAGVHCSSCMSTAGIVEKFQQTAHTFMRNHADFRTAHLLACHGFWVDGTLHGFRIAGDFRLLKNLQAGWVPDYVLQTATTNPRMRDLIYNQTECDGSQRR
ncbi:unnamed protein product [Amoebophrya sp. A120]|nr:unnamed protein product [Amoebophrya sp. A120]|eukprot:GSA120T00006448001.1